MQQSVFEIVKQVFSSWQVILAVIVIVLYLNVIFYIARRRKGPIKILKLSFKRKKTKQDKTNDVIVETGSGKNSNEELGLEEE